MLNSPYKMDRKALQQSMLQVSNINLFTYFMRCPQCQGSQYRKSVFDVSQKNPHGATCIFCKSSMIELKNIAA
ncbi:cold shock small protein YmcF [Pantoea sp. GL120224-02]|uniref:cold shock small protein YmcF n=1 Tax=Pantoea sp. GL120224-02 TaxID=1378084 RepID=UPI003F8DA12C